jgi:peroxiredoxin
MQAAASKGGVSLGIIKMYSELYFDNYKFNVTIPDPVLMQIPAGFKPEEKPKPLLSKGVIAPNWELTSTNGQTLSLASLKGKVILIDFTFNGCPACMLALPSLKKLHQKFDGANVAIVTINTSNSKEEVSKFIKNNNIKTPIYINGSQIAKSYNVQGGPIFYIINKQGEISEAYNGYFENFDTEIPAKIKALR